MMRMQEDYDATAFSKKFLFYYCIMIRMKEVTVNWPKNDAKALEERALDIVRVLKDVIKLEKYPELTITIHGTRKSYDEALYKQSEPWEVGTATRDHNIHILHPDAFEKYSTHNKSEFDGVLKHEVVHIFIGELSGNSYIPHWLNEGLANYLSHQGSDSQGSPYFIEQSFTSRLSSGRDWNSRIHDGAYAISRSFTKYLVDHYSLEKVLGLVKSLDRNFYEPVFREKFKQQFGVELSEVENNFALGHNS